MAAFNINDKPARGAVKTVCLAHMKTFGQAGFGRIRTVTLQALAKRYSTSK